MELKICLPYPVQTKRKCCPITKFCRSSNEEKQLKPKKLSTNCADSNNTINP